MNITLTVDYYQIFFCQIFWHRKCKMQNFFVFITVIHLFFTPSSFTLFLKEKKKKIPPLFVLKNASVIRHLTMLSFCCSNNRRKILCFSIDKGLNYKSCKEQQNFQQKKKNCCVKLFFSFFVVFATIKLSAHSQPIHPIWITEHTTEYTEFFFFFGGGT